MLRTEPSEVVLKDSSFLCFSIMRHQGQLACKHALCLLLPFLTPSFAFSFFQLFTTQGCIRPRSFMNIMFLEITPAFSPIFPPFVLLEVSFQFSCHMILHILYILNISYFREISSFLFLRLN